MRQFLRRLISLPAPEPIVRFETEPGLQMQADWATVGRGADRISVFIATVGWSRAGMSSFAMTRVETLIRFHKNGFVAFGDVPRKCARARSRHP